MKKKLIVLCLFWVAILIGFTYSKQLIVFTGKEVLLDIVPVDPRDLFRGDYVRLRYEISTIKREEVQVNYTKKDRRKRVVYVGLEKKDTSDTYKAIYLTVKKPEKGNLFIKGKTSFYYSEKHPIRVKYGIESFFVPEKKGRDIERIREGVKAKVFINDDGVAVLKSLIIDGKEIQF